MLIELLVFLFFLICGIGLLRGRFQWLLPEEKRDPAERRLRKKSGVTPKSRAVGLLFLFCAFCVLLLALGALLQQSMLSKAAGGLMMTGLIVGLVLISTGRKFLQ